MNWTLRDNGWAFGFGAAILSFPITTILLAESGPFRQGFDGALVAFCGSFGMLVACRSAYGYTRASSYRLERVVLLTSISFGMAFALAAVTFGFALAITAIVSPFSREIGILSIFLQFFFAVFLFAPVTGLVTWGIALAKLGVPILGLTVAWSWLYLATLGPRSSDNRRQSIFRDKVLEADQEAIILVWSLLSVASIIAILLMKYLNP